MAGLDLGRVTLSAATVVALSCGSELRTVPTGPHPGNAVPIIVDYPPPPAQQELIEKEPPSPCSWEDGHWTWLGRRWNWEPGRWVVPPDGCYYAPPSFHWIPSEGKGELYYLQPRWYPKDADSLPPQEALTRCMEIKPCGGLSKQADRD